MRILYDHQIFTLQKYGGISRYFAELIKNLSSTEAVECEVSLLCSNNNCLLDNNIFRPSYPARVMGHRISKRKQYFINKTCSGVSIFRGSYDIFHPTYFYDTYFLKLIKNRPYVITIYDMIYELYPDLFPKTDKVPENKKLLASKATKVIAISENTKKDILRLYDIDEEKIEVIYLASSMDGQSRGSELPDINSNNYPYSMMLRTLPERFILYVGHRFSYKNFNLFVSSISSILANDDSLFLVCAGSGEFSASELDYFEELTIKHKIIHIPIDDSILSYLYKKAIVFVFPSLYEGFGLPILESFSCGCPVALSNSSSFPEVAKDAAVYFDPLSKSSMEESISKVIYDEKLREILKERGYEMLNNYSWEKTAQETLNLYKNVI